MSKQQRIGIAVIGLVVVAGIGWYQFRRQTEPKVRTIEATVLSVDPAAGRAAIEFIHPKSGKRFEIAGELAPDCRIQIDRAPARLSDVRAGDKATITGAMHFGGRIVAQSVSIVRDAPVVPAAATEPGTGP